MKNQRRSQFVANRSVRFVACLFCVAGMIGMARGADPQWLTDAKGRIEQHRKANLTVKVTDASGNPVSDADVHVEMKKHTFGWGTAVTADWINNTSPEGEVFRQKLMQNFNRVVLEYELKWPAWTTESWGWGTDRANAMRALDWLKQHDMPVRGHFLCWATWSGFEAYGGSEDTATLPKRLFDYITDITTTVGDRVYEWDVINHPVGWMNDTYENRMGMDFFKQIIDHARAVTPKGITLWINEDECLAGTGRADRYEKIIDYLIENGSPPDGIGFQGHFVQEWGNRIDNAPVEEIYGRIERFAKKGLPLIVTEFDVDTRIDNDPDSNSVRFGPEDPERHGQLVRDYLTVMFSHPSMKAVIMWGFWGGAHYRGDAASLYRADWSEKPALKAYRDLVYRQWWTDVTGATGSSGAYDVRAFKGLYDITVTRDGQTSVLSDVNLDGDKTVEVSLK